MVQSATKVRYVSVEIRLICSSLNSEVCILTCEKIWLVDSSLCCSVNNSEYAFAYGKQWYKLWRPTCCPTDWDMDSQTVAPVFLAHPTHTHRLTALFSGTTRVSRYQKGKTNLDFTEAKYSEWQWHQLGHVQVYTSSLQTNNHTSNPPLKCA